MSNTGKQTPQALQKENAELRAQLSEAQQFIDAVRDGDVDALVVADSGGEQLLSLGDAEKVYRQLVEEMGEGAITLDAEGVILYANRRLAEMLNTPLEKLTGSNLDNWCSMENRTALHHFIQPAETSDARRRGEFMLNARDGSPVPVLLSLNRAPGDVDATQYTLIATDLSEQKQNEASAADERMARSILEQATDAIVVCDGNGRVIRASRVAQQLCSCLPVGEKFEHVFALLDDSDNAISLQQLIDEPDLQSSECWYTCNGTRYRLQVNAARIRGTQTETLGIVVTLNNVTQLKKAERKALDAKNELQIQLERSNRGRLALLSVVEDHKLTEKALRDSETHFRLALASLPILVWSMDVDLRYVWVYDHNLGEDPVSILGKTDSEIYHPDDAAYITDIKQRVLTTGEPLRKEIYATVAGRMQFFNYYIEPLRDESGEIIGLTGASVNVTSIRELEASKKTLSDALKQSGNATVMLDSDFKIEFVNQAFTDLFGYTQDELSGQPASVISSADYTATLQPSQIQEIVSKKDIFRGEVIRKSRTGELIPFYLTMAPLMNQLGELSGYVASYSDLRAIKASEKRTREALTDTITAICHTIEKRDPYTAGHQERVAELAVAIASEMGLDETHIEGLYLGSLIHDIGKIYIPSEILNRPGKLSEHEFGLITSHPDVGYEIIKDVKFDWPIANMVYQHHERIDGSGYPQGLKGDEICLEAKIIAVADVVEAMTSHRPYRAGLGVERALAQIESDAGTKLERSIVDCCLRLFREKDFTWSSSFSL